METLDVTLTVDSSGKYPAYLRIVDALGNGLSGASVTFDGDAGTTDANGEVLFLRSVGSYDAAIRMEHYKTENLSVTVDASGKTLTVMLDPTGADYDAKNEILTVQASYTAYTAKTGGEVIASGSCLRDTEDKVIYIEGADGVRVPLLIPLLEPDSDDWGEVSYVWSADHSAVTARRVHKYNTSHVEEETVTATGAVTRAPTCEAKGETTWTSAAFSNPAFAVQTDQAENLDPIAHDWGEPSYEWAEDYSTVTATVICRNDASHTMTETVQTTALRTESTYDAEGSIRYTGVFENAAFTTQTKSVPIPKMPQEDVNADGTIDLADFTQLFFWSIYGSEAWPIGGSAEHYDFNQDGKADAADAVGLAFRDGMFGSDRLGVLVIAAYENGRMTACVILDSSSELSNSQIALLKAAGELRVFFLSGGYTPLTAAAKAVKQG